LTSEPPGRSLLQPTHAYDGKTLQPKFVELLSIALDASVTHLYAPGTRRHSRASLPPVA